MTIQEKAVAESLQEFGIASRAAETPEELYLAVFVHAFLTSVALNPKQSRNGIKANWNCKFATIPNDEENPTGVKNRTLNGHYDWVASKLAAAKALRFTDARSTAEIQASTVAQGLLTLTPRLWMGLPGAFDATVAAKKAPATLDASF